MKHLNCGCSVVDSNHQPSSPLNNKHSCVNQLKARGFRLCQEVSNMDARISSKSNNFSRTNTEKFTSLDMFPTASNSEQISSDAVSKVFIENNSFEDTSKFSSFLQKLMTNAKTMLGTQDAVLQPSTCTEVPTKETDNNCHYGSKATIHSNYKIDVRDFTRYTPSDYCLCDDDDEEGISSKVESTLSITDNTIKSPKEQKTSSEEYSMQCQASASNKSKVTLNSVQTIAPDVKYFYSDDQDNSHREDVIPHFREYSHNKGKRKYLKGHTVYVNSDEGNSEEQNNGTVHPDSLIGDQKMYYGAQDADTNNRTRYNSIRYFNEDIQPSKDPNVDSKKNETSRRIFSLLDTAWLNPFRRDPQKTSNLVSNSQKIDDRANIDSLTNIPCRDITDSKRANSAEPIGMERQTSDPKEHISRETYDDLNANIIKKSKAHSCDPYKSRNTNFNKTNNLSEGTTSNSASNDYSTPNNLVSVGCNVDPPVDISTKTSLTNCRVCGHDEEYHIQVPENINRKQLAHTGVGSAIIQSPETTTPERGTDESCFPTETSPAIFIEESLKSGNHKSLTDLDTNDSNKTGLQQETPFSSLSCPLSLTMINQANSKESGIGITNKRNNKNKKNKTEKRKKNNWGNDYSPSPKKVRSAHKQKDQDNQCAFIGSPVLVSDVFKDTPKEGPQKPQQDHAHPMNCPTCNSNLQTSSLIPGENLRMSRPYREDDDRFRHQSGGISGENLRMSWSYRDDDDRFRHQSGNRFEERPKDDYESRISYPPIERIRYLQDKTFDIQDHFSWSSGKVTLDPKFERLTSELQTENKILKSELLEMKLELKHALEKVEGPMKSKLEAEKFRCEKLQQELQRASHDMNLSKEQFLRESKKLKNQLFEATSNMAQLEGINLRLKDEMYVLDGLCAKLEEDLVNQKLNEAETLKRITQRKFATEKLVYNEEDIGNEQLEASYDYVKEGDTRNILNQSNLNNIVRKLGTPQKASVPCPDHINIPTDLTGAAKMIRDLKDMVENGKGDRISVNTFAVSKNNCSCQSPPNVAVAACQYIAVNDIGIVVSKSLFPSRPPSRDNEAIPVSTKTLYGVPQDFFIQNISSKNIMDNTEVPSASSPEPDLPFSSEVPCLKDQCTDPKTADKKMSYNPPINPLMRPLMIETEINYETKKGAFGDYMKDPKGNVVTCYLVNTPVYPLKPTTQDKASPPTMKDKSTCFCNDDNVDEEDVLASETFPYVENQDVPLDDKERLDVVPDINDNFKSCADLESPPCKDQGIPCTEAINIPPLQNNIQSPLPAANLKQTCAHLGYPCRKKKNDYSDYLEKNLNIDQNVSKKDVSTEDTTSKVDRKSGSETICPVTAITRGVGETKKVSVPCGEDGPCSSFDRPCSKIEEFMESNKNAYEINKGDFMEGMGAELIKLSDNQGEKADTTPNDNNTVDIRDKSREQTTRAILNMEIDLLKDVNPETGKYNIAIEQAQTALITTVIQEGNLGVKTEGPTGTIKSTLKYLPGGIVEVQTEITGSIGLRQPATPFPISAYTDQSEEKPEKNAIPKSSKSSLVEAESDLTDMEICDDTSCPNKKNIKGDQIDNEEIIICPKTGRPCNVPVTTESDLTDMEIGNDTSSPNKKNIAGDQIDIDKIRICPKTGRPCNDPVTKQPCALKDQLRSAETQQPQLRAAGAATDPKAEREQGVESIPQTNTAASYSVPVTDKTTSQIRPTIDAEVKTQDVYTREIPTSSEDVTISSPQQTHEVELRGISVGDEDTRVTTGSSTDPIEKTSKSEYTSDFRTDEMTASDMAQGAIEKETITYDYEKENAGTTSEKPSQSEKAVVVKPYKADKKESNHATLSQRDCGCQSTVPPVEQSCQCCECKEIGVSTSKDAEYSQLSENMVEDKIPVENKQDIQTDKGSRLGIPGGDQLENDEYLSASDKLKSEAKETVSALDEIVDRDQNIIQDEEFIRPTGMLLKQDEEIVALDKKIIPIGTILPDGSHVLSDGNIQRPDGTIIREDGEIQPIESAVHSDEPVSKLKGSPIPLSSSKPKKGQLPEGYIIEPDGSIQPVGSKLLPDGTILRPDGNVVYPDGTVKSPDGKILPLKRSIELTQSFMLPDGTIVQEDGTIKGQDGKTYPSGSKISPEGTILPPDRIAVNQEGIMTADSKKLEKISQQTTQKPTSAYSVKKEIETKFSGKDFPQENNAMNQKKSQQNEMDLNGDNNLDEIIVPPKKSEPKGIEEPKISETTKPVPPKKSDTKGIEEPKMSETTKTVPPKQSDTKGIEEPKISEITETVPPKKSDTKGIEEPKISEITETVPPKKSDTKGIEEPKISETTKTVHPSEVDTTPSVSIEYKQKEKLDEVLNDEEVIREEDNIVEPDRYVIHEHQSVQPTDAQTAGSFTRTGEIAVYPQTVRPIDGGVSRSSEHLIRLINEETGGTEDTGKAEQFNEEMYIDKPTVDIYSYDTKTEHESVKDIKYQLRKLDEKLASEVPDLVSKLSSKHLAPFFEIADCGRARKKRSSKLDIKVCTCSSSCTCIVCSSDIMKKRASKSTRKEPKARDKICYCKGVPSKVDDDRYTSSILRKCETYLGGPPCNKPKPLSILEKRSKQKTKISIDDVFNPSTYKRDSENSLKKGNFKNRHPADCECVDCLCSPMIHALSTTREFFKVDDHKQIYQVSDIKCFCPNSKKISKIPISTNPSVPKVKTPGLSCTCDPCICSPCRDTEKATAGPAGPAKDGEKDPLALPTMEDVMKMTPEQLAALCDCDPCSCEVCYNKPATPTDPINTTDQVPMCCCRPNCTCEFCQVEEIKKQIEKLKQEIDSLKATTPTIPETAHPDECDCELCKCPLSPERGDTGDQTAVPPPVQQGNLGDCDCTECMCPEGPNKDKLPTPPVGDASAHADDCDCDICQCPLSPMKDRPKTPGHPDGCDCDVCKCPLAPTMGDAMGCNCGDYCVCPGAPKVDKTAKPMTGCSCKPSCLCPGGPTPICDCPNDCSCSPCPDPRKQLVLHKTQDSDDICTCAECKCFGDEIPEHLQTHPDNCVCDICKCADEKEEIQERKPKTVECDCPICKCGEGDGDPKISDIPGHPQGCTCDVCKCGEEEGKESPHQEDCICEVCKCEDEEQKTHPQGCICDVCKCEPEPEEQKIHPEGCICDICKCEPENQPPHPEGCICDICKCEPPEKPSDQQPASTPGQGDTAITKVETIATHSIKCDCKECTCAESTGAKTDTLKSSVKSSETHSMECKCDECKCAEEIGSPGVIGSEIGQCKCGDCNCTDCYYKQDNLLHSKDCQCSICTCVDCSKKISQINEMGRSQKYEEKYEEKDTCKCITCICDPCIVKTIPKKIVECKCGVCICLDCEGERVVEKEKTVIVEKEKTVIEEKDKTIIVDSLPKDRSCHCIECYCDECVNEQKKGSKARPEINIQTVAPIMKTASVQHPVGCTCLTCICYDCVFKKLEGQVQTSPIGKPLTKDTSCHCAACLCEDCMAVPKKGEAQGQPKITRPETPVETRGETPVETRVETPGSTEAPLFEIPQRIECDCKTCTCYICAAKATSKDTPRDTPKDTAKVTPFSGISDKRSESVAPVFEIPQRSPCVCSNCTCPFNCKGLGGQSAQRQDDGNLGTKRVEVQNPEFISPAKVKEQYAEPQFNSVEVTEVQNPEFISPAQVKEQYAEPQFKESELRTICYCDNCKCTMCNKDFRPASAPQTDLPQQNVQGPTPTDQSAVSRQTQQRPTSAPDEKSKEYCACAICSCPINCVNSTRSVEKPSQISAKVSQQQSILRPKSALSADCRCPECCLEKPTTGAKITSSSKQSAKAADQNVCCICPNCSVCPKPSKVDLTTMDDETLVRNIESSTKESCACKEQIKEIRSVLRSIKKSCFVAEKDIAEKQIAEKKPLIKQASDFKQTMSGLKLALINLQEKCKAKDKMIKQMTGELKTRTSSETLWKVLNTYTSEAPDYDKADDVKDKIQFDTLYPVKEEKSTFDEKVAMATKSGRAKKQTKSCKCGKSPKKSDIRNVDLAGFEVIDIKRIVEDSIIIKWEPPKSNLVTGYEIFINGLHKSKIMSGGRTSAMINSIDLSITNQVTIYAVTKSGRCEPPAIAIYEVGSRK